MPMQSTQLLPELSALPTTGAGRHSSFRELLNNLDGADRSIQGAEFAAAVTTSMWGVFSAVNIDDQLLEAYEVRWPGLAPDSSLYELHHMRLASGEDVSWLHNGLKGKLAEFNAEEWLESNGYTEITFPDTEVNPGWDLRAIDPQGQETFISVKTGGEGYASDVIGEMEANSSLEFIVGSEVYDRIAQSHPELVDRIIADVGPDHALVEGIEDGLETLSSNLGIDVPDGLVDVIPYAAAVIAAVRLIYGALRTEREFKEVDRTERNKLQVVQALTLMSRMGVTTVLATVGGQGGAAVGGIAGTAVPGVGNFIGGAAGGLGGSLLGAGIGMYLNRHLQPHMLDLALKITNLTNDDLFYYKNKQRIEVLAESFRTTARELATAPALSFPASGYGHGS